MGPELARLALGHINNNNRQMSPCTRYYGDVYVIDNIQTATKTVPFA